MLSQLAVPIRMSLICGEICGEKATPQSGHLQVLEKMAGTTGLEPAASAVTGQRSNQLNYVPTLKNQDFLEVSTRRGFCRFCIRRPFCIGCLKQRAILAEPPINRL
jgi:hypothetical protein